MGHSLKQTVATQLLAIRTERQEIQSYFLATLAAGDRLILYLTPVG